MQLYYAALPVFADERCIEAIINCLCSKLWNSYTIEKKHFLNKNASEYMYNDYSPEPTKQSIEVLEQRYNDESLLMEYVAHGDFESIDKLAHLNSSGIKPRLSDSIRDRKNFMIILNTLAGKLPNQHMFILFILMRYHAICYQDRILYHNCPA